MTGMGLVGMHRLAAENGDGFTLAFLEVMMRVQLEATGPRLVVSNDRIPASGRSLHKHKARSVPLALVKMPATAL